MIRALHGIAALTALAATACAAAGPGGTGEVAIRVTPVEIEGGELKGLELRGAVALSADHRRFGGFSGLSIDDGHMVAVSDQGWWLLADLNDDALGLRPARAGLARMRGTDGAVYHKNDGDAEGLTTRDGNLMVSFERDHRIMAHLGDGVLGDEIRDRGFEELASNKGLEALATTPDGWLLAIAETPHNGGFPMFLVHYSGEVSRASLPATSRHFATGADVGPDGRLYLLLRDYTPVLGVSIRILRYRLGEDGFPMPASREVLARIESDSGIDNMEGISLWTDGAGRTRLTLISDDNFSPLQRTLLMDFVVLD